MSSLSDLDVLTWLTYLLLSYISQMHDLIGLNVTPKPNMIGLRELLRIDSLILTCLLLIWTFGYCRTAIFDFVKKLSHRLNILSQLLYLLFKLKCFWSILRCYYCLCCLSRFSLQINSRCFYILLIRFLVFT